MDKYFNNSDLLQSTLLPYFNAKNPLKLINKKFDGLNYQKYLTHIPFQPHGIFKGHISKDKLVVHTYNNGKLDGPCEIWHKNGQIYKRYNYKNGKVDGLFEKWYLNDQLHYRTNYINGKRNGTAERWYPNGSIHVRYSWNNGKIEGLWEEWDINGKLKMKKNYKPSSETLFRSCLIM
jgi:antitoxin component YwqK of YwqJK toxin-antitoxin module